MNWATPPVGAVTGQKPLANGDTPQTEFVKTELAVVPQVRSALLNTTLMLEYQPLPLKCPVMTTFVGADPLKRVAVLAAVNIKYPKAVP